MLLSGPPGTGKNTFTYAIVKKYQEYFPNSKLLCADITKIVAPYVGVPEKNLANFTEFAISEARALKAKDPNAKLIVFLDEFDRIAMMDFGNSAHNSNALQTELKTSFNRFFKEDNIVIIGATNKAVNPKTPEEAAFGVIESALADRFGAKILVSNPVSDAINHTIRNRFKDSPGVYDNLKQKGNPDLEEFCNIVTDKAHNFSYRSLNAIIDSIELDDKKKMGLKELIESTLNLGDSIHLTEPERLKLKNIQKRLQQS